MHACTRNSNVLHSILYTKCTLHELFLASFAAVLLLSFYASSPLSSIGIVTRFSEPIYAKKNFFQCSRVFSNQLSSSLHIVRNGYVLKVNEYKSITYNWISTAVIMCPFHCRVHRLEACNCFRIILPMTRLGTQTNTRLMTTTAFDNHITIFLEDDVGGLVEI